MDVLYGVAGRDYVVLACDTMYRNNVLVPKNDYKKYVDICGKSAVISGGKQGDCSRVVQGVLEGLRYESIANGLEISEKVFANALQMEIYGRLRKAPVEVCSIIGGMSEGSGRLYMVDQYGACSSYKHMAYGYGAPFFITCMKKRHTEDTSAEETIEIIKEVYEGVKRKLVLNYGSMYFYIITKEGTQRIEE
ncbi:20S proteasome subunit beta 4 [Nematocida major]|uniref:20S proteasome subunit beta 4 n=1 Tax=Nematocida major TaxID=1912982 RepID=UPI0020087225|nr:20S proteasome subunit beta 4 [Nematocida major]KAH9386222.1 20S proteasome subunit beta 4 [Nematocida major]